MVAGRRAIGARARGCARRLPLAAMLAAMLAGLACPAAAGAVAPFRLCADPDNLPFSSRSDETPGFYIELGRAIADRLGRPFEPVWELTYFARRAVRTSLLSGRCDGFIGLPEEPDLMGPKLIFSKPVLGLGYALVLPRGLSVKSLSDLDGRRVAVPFASPPQSLLATRSEVQTVTTTSPEEAMNDLKEGRVDLAFIWGPSAGWIDKSAFGGAYDVLPVAGAHMQWRAAIGFRSEDVGLRDEVDAAIAALAGPADALMTKYGFPKASPVVLVEPAPPPPDSGGPSGPARKTEAAPPAAQTAAASPRPSSDRGLAGDAVAGRKLFNTTCSHCHGPDAVQGERRRNLRLLQRRYGGDFDQAFMNTVTHGRVDKGMPSWSGVLDEAQFRNILAFLRSVQEP
jgi:polar amino acid transport system substrate-binding protein